MEIEEVAKGLTVRTPAKLNLYLEVMSRRADGFHELDSLFQAISLYDELELEATADGEVALEERGIAVGDDNLVARAARLLRRECLPLGSSAGARIRLSKRIPHGAGLGGGSSDAAATLVALAKLWRVDIRRSELAKLGSRLGSDVPFFLYGGTARCRGRGERVTSLAEAFDAAPPFHYVIVFPAVSVPTRAIYEALDEGREGEFTLTRTSRLDSMSPALIRQRLVGGELYFNRLEHVTCGLFPVLEKFRLSLSREPFLHTLMTGSGSAFFGVCGDERICETLAERLSKVRGGEGDEIISGEMVSRAGASEEVFQVKSLASWDFPWLCA